MTRLQSQKFYNSPAWRSMSRHIRARDKWLCQGCLPRRVGAKLVHHIRAINAGGSPLQESNLISLCADCHRARHGQVVDEGKQAWKAYIKDLMEKF